MLYVACSRATSAAGLTIVGRFDPPTRADNESSDLDKELERQNSALLTPCFRFLHEPRVNNIIQLMFHNVQSLRLHQNQIIADQCYLNSDFILLAETWTILTDIIGFPSFSSDCRVDCPDNRRRAYGCCCLVKNEQLEYVNQASAVSNHLGNHHISFSFFIHKENTLIISGYASPNAPASEIIQILKPILDMPFQRKIFSADLNANLMEVSRKSQDIKAFLNSQNMYSMLNRPTTIHNTQIDVIFASFPVRVAGNYISPTASTHDPLYLHYIEN